MKTTFTTFAEVCHIFAQRSQTEAKTNSVFMRKDYPFSGEYANKIYSYGYHYLIGEFLPTSQGEILIINNNGYSSSTSKHIAALRGATSHIERYFLLSVSLDMVYPAILESYKKLLKAKKPDLYINEIISLNDSLNGFKSKFGGYLTNDRNQSFKIIASLDKEQKEKIKEINKIVSNLSPEKIKESAEKAKKAAIQAAKKKETEDKNRLKKWFNFEISTIHDLKEDFLRVNGDSIETTKGVKIPLCEAVKLYKYIQSGKDVKGYKIEHYTVISLNGVLQVGCHKINVENMHKVGKSIV